MRVVQVINRNIYEVVFASQLETPNEKPIHAHKDIKDYDIRKVYIADDSSAYELLLAIANTDSGEKVAYAKRNLEVKKDLFEKIKKAESRGTSPSGRLDGIVPRINPKSQEKFSLQSDPTTSSNNFRFSLQTPPENIETITDKVISGTLFSGGGMVDTAVASLIHSSFAVEYDDRIQGVYLDNNDTDYMG